MGIGQNTIQPISELSSNYYNASPYSSTAFSSPPYGSMSSQPKLLNTPPTHQLSNMGISRSSTQSMFYNPIQGHYQSNYSNNSNAGPANNSNSNSGGHTNQPWSQQYYR